MASNALGMLLSAGIKLCNLILAHKSSSYGLAVSRCRPANPILGNGYLLFIQFTKCS